MYMGPIAAAETRADHRLDLAALELAAPPSRVPAHPALRMAVGVPVLLLAVLVMLPWAAVIAVSAGAVLGIRTCLRAPRAVVQAADHAGRVALGR